MWVQRWHLQQYASRTFRLACRVAIIVVSTIRNSQGRAFVEVGPRMFLKWEGSDSTARRLQHRSHRVLGLSFGLTLTRASLVRRFVGKGRAVYRSCMFYRVSRLFVGVIRAVRFSRRVFFCVVRSFCFVFFFDRPFQVGVYGGQRRRAYICSTVVGFVCECFYMDKSNA